MNRPRSRRDFILDSGALSHFAVNMDEYVLWTVELNRDFDAPSVLVPAPALTECITGDPRRDVGINRLLSTLTNPADPEGHILMPSKFTFARAGVLRTLAISKRSPDSKFAISTTDAQIVALAEERSAFAPVVVTTSDLGDIQLLVDLTGARNIGVQAV